MYDPEIISSEVLTSSNALKGSLSHYKTICLQNVDIHFQIPLSKGRFQYKLLIF